MMVTHKILGLLVLLVTVYSSPTPKKLRVADDAYRLPATVIPSKYTLALTFPATAFTKEGTEFQGVATIEFNVTETIKELKFHLSKDFITVTKLTVGSSELAATKYTLDEDTEILTIPITEDVPINVGTASTMIIEYTGAISTADNYGIYKSSYTNAKKETIYLLATQFEPVYARRVFPCFDEPSFKATFDVTVTYPKNLGVLFNTEKKDELSESENTNTVVFKTTPVMSSYLIALVISDFTSTPGVSETEDAIANTVWSRSDLSKSRKYASEVTPKILQQLNEYTGRLYSEDMSKVDQIAIPDTTAGAMENWGLVTYREQYLLWNEEDSSTISKQVTANIITHELAHQWFGNLITCDWWSDTFLNEGFATYFEYFITHKVETTWALDKQFVLDVLQQVLEADASEDSQALESAAFTPLQVSEKFGSISYKKGGSIIRMVSHIMGEEKFKAGIQDYVKSAELQHATSIPSKLWDILHLKANGSLLPADTTLTTIMKNWVEKAGYPLLTVTLEGKNLKISQKRFLLTGEDKETKWYVPITYVESASTSETKFQETTPKKWLTPAAPEITIELENENKWVLLNSLQTGYYRVTYDTNLWTNIAEALDSENFGGIVDLSRAQIVDDLFSLAQSKQTNYSDVFNTIDFLRKDDSYYSWIPAFKGFNYMIQRITEGEKLRTSIENQLLNLTVALFKSVSFEDVKDQDQISSFKQVLATSWACKLGQTDCVAKANAAYAALKTNATKPNKNLKSVVYCNALKNSEDVTDYEYLWKLYSSTDIPTEKNTILNSLGCSKNKDKLTELLTEAIKPDSTIIRAQDSLTAFAAVYSGTVTGTDVALDFLSDKVTDIFSKFASTSSKKSLIKGIAGMLTTDAQADKLRALIDSPKFPTEIKADSEKAFKQAQANIIWMSEHQADLEKFFDEPSTESTTTGSTTTGSTTTGSTTTVSTTTGNTPTGNTPTGNTPTGNTPTGNTPTGNTPTGNTPTGNTPTGNTPTGNTPTGNTPTGNTPTGNTPTGNTPTGNTPTGNTPTGSTPGGASTIQINMALLALASIILGFVVL